VLICVNVGVKVVGFRVVGAVVFTTCFVIVGAEVFGTVVGWKVTGPEVGGLLVLFVSGSLVAFKYSGCSFVNDRIKASTSTYHFEEYVAHDYNR